MTTLERLAEIETACMEIAKRFNPSAAAQVPLHVAELAKMVRELMADQNEWNAKICQIAKNGSEISGHLVTLQSAFMECRADINAYVNGMPQSANGLDLSHTANSSVILPPGFRAHRDKGGCLHVVSDGSPRCALEAT